MVLDPDCKQALAEMTQHLLPMWSVMAEFSVLWRHDDGISPNLHRYYLDELGLQFCLAYSLSFTRPGGAWFFRATAGTAITRLSHRAILSVHLSICPSVRLYTWVDQSKTVQARITKPSPSRATAGGTETFLRGPRNMFAWPLWGEIFGFFFKTRHSGAFLYY